MINLHCIFARKRLNFVSCMLVSFWHTCFSQECAENEDFYTLASLMSSSGGQLNSILRGKAQAAVIETQASCLSGAPSCSCLYSAVMCWKSCWGIFPHSFCKVCVCCTQALVTCSCALCAQSFVSSVLVNAKLSTETLPLISDEDDQCTCLKSVPKPIKLHFSIINPCACTEW